MRQTQRGPCPKSLTRCDRQQGLDQAVALAVKREVGAQDGGAAETSLCGGERAQLLNPVCGFSSYAAPHRD